MLMKEIYENFILNPCANETIVGNGLLARFWDKYVFVISNPVFWELKNVVNYTCMGGKIAPSEEILDSVRREVKEEMGVDCEIFDSKETFYVNYKNECSSVILRDKIRPIFIFERRYPGTPKNPKENGFWQILVFSFLGEIKEGPAPSSEIPAVLLLTQNQIALTKKEILVRELIRHGAVLIEKIKVPRNLPLRPMFSPEILVELGFNLDDLFRKFAGGKKW